MNIKFQIIKNNIMFIEIHQKRFNSINYFASLLGFSCKFNNDFFLFQKMAVYVQLTVCWPTNAPLLGSSGKADRLNKIL